MADPRSKKVVIDSVLTDTLLALAVQEGLLEEDDQKTDMYLRRYERYPLNARLKEVVLEQVVLTPQIITTKHMPLEHFSGELVERGGIINVDPPEDNLFEFGSFSKPIIDAMLRSRNHIIPEEDFVRKVNKANEAFKEQAAYTKRTGKEPPNLAARELRDFLSRTMGFSFEEDEYTSDEYAEQEIRKRAIEEARPILECTREYLEIITVASKENALIRIPLASYPVEHSVEPLFTIESKENQDIALFRVVATELGKLTFRATLEESLRLADQSNTEALREQLAKWKQSLQRGEIDNLGTIQKEVKEATSELAKLSSTKNVGKITVLLSLPVSALEMLTGLPPALGLTLNLIGLASQQRRDETESALKWAMFGNT